MPDLSRLLYVLPALVIAITVHEFFHAWIAYQLGDPTAKYMGRVSLNPLVHLDPVGSVMMLITSLTGMGLGWGKPVPVNPNNLKNGPIVGDAMVSVAGPLSNLLTAGIAAIPLRLYLAGLLPVTSLTEILLNLMAVLFNVSIFLAVFNLLPIFPLDGYHFWLGVLHELPSKATRQLWANLYGGPFQTYGPLILLALVFWGQSILGRILNPAYQFFSRLFLGQLLR